MSKEQGVLDFVLENVPAGDPAALIEAVDSYKSDNGISMMNLGAKKGAVVDKALKESGATRVLELGSYFGYSITRMAHLIGPAGKLITVDADDHRHAVSSQMVQHAGLEDRVSLLLGRAEDLIPTLEGPFDFVLIDHYADNYLSDLQLIEAEGLIRPGSVVAADNVVAHRPTVDGYLEHVRNSGLYDSTLHEVGSDGVEISVRLG